MILFMSYYVSGILKIILQHPRPFFDDPDVSPLIFCSLGFGNPAGHTLLATAFYLTLWHILYANSKFQGKKYIKYLTLTLCILLIIIINISTFFSGLNNLNQVIFRSLLGFGIYLTTLTPMSK